MKQLHTFTLKLASWRMMVSARFELFRVRLCRNLGDTDSSLAYISALLSLYLFYVLILVMKTR